MHFRSFLCIMFINVCFPQNYAQNAPTDSVEISTENESDVNNSSLEILNHQQEENSSTENPQSTTEQKMLIPPLPAEPPSKKETTTTYISLHPSPKDEQEIDEDKNIRCDKVKCIFPEPLTVKIKINQRKIAWGSNATLLCSVKFEADTDVSFIWTFRTNDYYEDEEVNIFSVFLKEETITGNGLANETIHFESILTIINVSDAETGYYICEVELQKHCCRASHSINIVTFKPPHYNADITIVVAVCLLQIIMIISLHAYSHRKKRYDMIPMNVIQYEPAKNLSCPNLQEK